MQLPTSTLLAIALTLLPPTAHAWRLQLYRDAGYLNRVEDRSGTLGQPCKNLPAPYDNSVSSMKWDGGNFGIECTIKLYDGYNCVTEIGSSKGDWNIPNFSPAHNDKLSSYRIYC
jgi:hypothetical protein